MKRSYKNNQYEKPKNGKSRRVDLSDQCIDALKKLRGYRNRKALAQGGNSFSEIIFSSGDKPIAQNSLRYIFKQLLKKLD